MENNPTLEPIQSALLNRSQRWAEHQLITYLTHLDEFQWPFEEKEAASAHLTLFKKHFLVMNALYQLQRRFAQQGQQLSISASGLEIVLYPPAMQDHTEDPPQNQQNSQHDDALTANDHNIADFYLDWEHYHSANAESVEALMRTFWQKFNAYHQHESAYEILGIEKNANRKAIERRYRQLASLHHPDKGGKQAKFIEIRQAYEKLIRATG